MFAGKAATGDSDGPCSSASFRYPTGLAVAADGVVYVVDKGNRKIKKIFAGNSRVNEKEVPIIIIYCAESVTTVAGTGEEGQLDGPCLTATFKSPARIAIDQRDGAIYVADAFKIRRIYDGTNIYISHLIPHFLLGQVITIAGSERLGHFDGRGIDALFNTITAITLHNGTLFSVENDYVRKIILP